MITIKHMTEAEPNPIITQEFDVLNKDELKTIKEFTKSNPPNRMFYGRDNFLILKSKSVLGPKNNRYLFKHQKKSVKMLEKITPILEKNMKLMIKKIYHAKSKKRPSELNFETYLDRTYISKNNNKEDTANGVNWHKDPMEKFDGDGEIAYADYTSVLMLTKNNDDWKGGNFLLQNGGKETTCGYHIPENKTNYVMIPKHNASIMFENKNAIHAVDKLTPLKNKDVTRDVLIITCLEMSK